METSVHQKQLSVCLEGFVSIVVKFHAWIPNAQWNGVPPDLQLGPSCTFSRGKEPHELLDRHVHW